MSFGFSFGLSGLSLVGLCFGGLGAKRVWKKSGGFSFFGLGSLGFLGNGSHFGFLSAMLSEVRTNKTEVTLSCNSISEERLHLT